MKDPLMSQHTKDLLLLLSEDGVDRDELRALVESAFQDGLAYMVKHYDACAKKD